MAANYPVAVPPLVRSTLETIFADVSEVQLIPPFRSNRWQAYSSGTDQYEVRMSKAQMAGPTQNLRLDVHPHSKYAIFYRLENSERIEVLFTSNDSANAEMQNVFLRNNEKVGEVTFNARAETVYISTSSLPQITYRNGLRQGLGNGLFTLPIVNSFQVVVATISHRADYQFKVCFPDPQLQAEYKVLILATTQMIANSVCQALKQDAIYLEKAMDPGICCRVHSVHLSLEQKMSILNNSLRSMIFSNFANKEYKSGDIELVYHKLEDNTNPGDPKIVCLFESLPKHSKYTRVQSFPERKPLFWFEPAFDGEQEHNQTDVFIGDCQAGRVSHNEMLDSDSAAMFYVDHTVGDDQPKAIREGNEDGRIIGQIFRTDDKILIELMDWPGIFGTPLLYTYIAKLFGVHRMEANARYFPLQRDLEDYVQDQAITQMNEARQLDEEFETAAFEGAPATPLVIATVNRDNPMNPNFRLQPLETYAFGLAEDANETNNQFTLFLRRCVFVNQSISHIYTATFRKEKVYTNYLLEVQENQGAVDVHIIWSKLAGKTWCLARNLLSQAGCQIHDNSHNVVGYLLDTGIFDNQQDELLTCRRAWSETTETVYALTMNKAKAIGWMTQSKHDKLQVKLTMKDTIHEYEDLLLAAYAIKFSRDFRIHELPVCRVNNMQTAFVWYKHANKFRLFRHDFSKRVNGLFECSNFRLTKIGQKVSGPQRNQIVGHYLELFDLDNRIRVGICQVSIMVGGSKTLVLYDFDGNVLPILRVNDFGDGMCSRVYLSDASLYAGTIEHRTNVSSRNEYEMRNKHKLLIHEARFDGQDIYGQDILQIESICDAKVHIQLQPFDIGRVTITNDTGLVFAFNNYESLFLHPSNNANKERITNGRALLIACFLVLGAQTLHTNNVAKRAETVFEMVDKMQFEMVDKLQ